jgi:hypothetical protein
LNHPTIDGLRVILDELSSKYAAIRKRCAWILATGLQNNPKFQSICLELGITKLLYNALQQELEKKEDLESAGKIVYAISSLLDHNRKAQQEFWTLGGVKLISAVLRISPHELSLWNSQADNLPFSSQSPAESTSSERTPTPQSTDAPKEEKKAEEEEEKPKNIVASIEIVDMCDKIQQRAAVVRSTEHQKEDAVSLWHRLTLKIVFFLYKMMEESEPFKLAFAKEDGSSTVLATLIHLLQREDTSLDLQEKILMAIRAMSNCPSNAKMQEYILNILSSNQQLHQALLQLQQKLLKEKDSETHSELLQTVNHLLEHIYPQQQQKQ